MPHVPPAPDQPPVLATLTTCAAERTPDVALFADDGWPAAPGPVTDFATFDRAVTDLAGRLWTAGVRPRATVAIVFANHPRIQLAAFACHRIGAIPALISSAMPDDYLVGTLEALHPTWTIVDSAVAARLSARVREAIDRNSRGRVLRTRAHDGDQPPAVLPELPAPGTPDAQRLRDDEVALITHTSGTTDLPKLVAHSAASIYQHVVPQLGLMTSFGTHRLSAKAISFVHARASSAIITCLLIGMPIGCITDDDPARVADFLHRHGPESLETHPNTCISGEGLASDPRRPMRTISRFSSTFDAIHPRTVRAMLDASDAEDAYFFQAYGQTESGPLAGRPITRADVYNHDTRVIGIPAAGRTVRIVGDDGKPVPFGTAGHIECLSVSQMVGYVGRPTPAVTDSWWRMGDVGRVRPDGTLELLDRLVDKVPGIDSTLALEDLLLARFPALQEALILGSDDGAVDVIITVKTGSTIQDDDVENALRDRGVANIRLHRLLPADLPMTGSKKVRRTSLRSKLDRL